ncbi:MAG: NAD-dependent malic enzyme, partial [Myxococcales bacterium]|nr:NAD-dependent malic enzyme [Myxococcales bacterium]
YQWSQGRAVVATGSPFDDVWYGDEAHPIGQGNNAFIFPGLGFGAILSEASQVTDGMVAAAAYALADYTEVKHLRQGRIYPPISELQPVSIEVAIKVVEQAMDEGVARIEGLAREDIRARVESHFWEPVYLPIRKKA